MKKILYTMLVALMTAFTFTSCEDVPAPYDIPNGGNGGETTTEVAEGNGTVDSPYNPLAVVQYIKSLEAGVNSSNYVYIKGIVSSTKEISAQFGNASFYISADGTTTGTQFYVYRVKGLGNKNIASDDEVKVGDEVIICAKVVNYGGNTPETVQGEGYIYSLNGKTEGGTTPSTGQATGDGSKENPFNSVAANQMASKLASGAKTDKQYYIKGKVVSVKEAFSAQYGNASFYISDDGKEDNKFYVFRTLYLGNEKWTEGKTNVAVGDEVVVCGSLINYMGNTPETVQGETYLVSLKSNGGGTETPDTPEVGEGLTLDTTNGIVTMMNSGVAEGSSIEVSVEDMNLTDDGETGTEVTTITLSDGTKIEFDGGGETNKAKYFKKYQAIRVYKNNGFTVTGKSKIAKIVFTCDGAQYVGNKTATLTFSGNTATYKNVYTEEKGGGVQFRFKSVKIVYAK
ncbi:hypothetical protein [Prevotella sp.]|uniref:hypothetical protein n=1 Tax=uncultured Prevotella sp. TaxID=159272 RepID=UPI0025E56C1A|nr:hypothetical protein [Prevotella sp.]